MNPYSYVKLGSFNNPDKGAVGHQIVHRALWEYLQEINTEDEASADKKRQEIFEGYAISFAALTLMPFNICFFCTAARSS